VRAARLPLTLRPSRHVSPAGLLMRQIRGSDFLERNPATGPSLFDLAALHQDAGGEEMEVLMGASAVQPGSTDGMESVEDLARKLVLQVCRCPCWRTAGSSARSCLTLSVACAPAVALRGRGVPGVLRSKSRSCCL
jgi:hypothetical protein